MVAVSGSSRGAILSVIAFFVVGGLLLSFVNVEEGQRAARAAEKGTPASH
jgi:UMF1 family MFS transporter